MKVIAFLIFFITTSASSAEPCGPASQSSVSSIEGLSRALSLNATYVKECVDSEIFDPLLDPFRKQSFALSLCQKSESCLEFLREEAARVSDHEKSRYANLPATALWGEILMQSGRTRRPPPNLADFPLPQDPEILFAQLKEQALKETKLNQNEQLKVACAGLVALIGPGKLKGVSAIKASSALSQIHRTHDVEKLLSKNRLPSHVKERFLKWSQEVEKKGLTEVKKSPGYHDEPLAGHPGWHSVRLNDGFRACYQIVVQNGLEMIQVFSISNDHKNYCRK